jgi:hypothetical protein
VRASTAIDVATSIQRTEHNRVVLGVRCLNFLLLSHILTYNDQIKVGPIIIPETW